MLKIGSIDLKNFLLISKMNNDIQLQTMMLFLFYFSQKTVTVNGEVRRESIFELKQDESFKDLENIFGGYLSQHMQKEFV